MMNRCGWKMGWLAICLAAPVAYAAAVGTAVTYQGVLTDGGQPADGLFDIRASLFDALTGGAQVGPVVTKTNVSASAGLFTTDLDFGNVFGDVALFMQLQVSPAGLNQFETLAPRQRLTPTPFALKVPGIDGHSLNAADGSPIDALFVDNDGRVGIGTTTPTHRLHVANAEPTLALQDTDSTTQQVGYVSYRDSGNVERGWVGYGTPGSPHLSVVNARPSGRIELQTFGGGGSVFLPTDFLGVGTSSPTSPVHIASDLNAVIQLQDIGPNATQSGYVDFRNSSGVETGWMGFGTPGSPHMSMVNARSGGNIELLPLGGGVVTVPVLEITGADLAEKFPASEKLEPGRVVAIDAANPGKLCLARGAYNRCVAGIVSGANNFPVGAVLGTAPENKDAPSVALSGRVYVWCDASSGAIEPGDLLTTSDTAGYAMKAADAQRSHGAVLGKAMEPLANGQKGLVLALVNLQ